MIDKTKPSSVFTASYVYGSTDEEFVFACKGRPFAVLVSDNLPTPATNLIDHTLVRELGLKMSDLQCRKYFFAGHRMRVLGRISTAVQCVKDGRTNGSFHLKGLVVTNLDQFLDTQVIAGTKMRGNIQKTFSKLFNERKCVTEDSDGVNSDTSLESDVEDNERKCLAEDSDGLNSDNSESDSEVSDVTPWEAQLCREVMYPRPASSSSITSSMPMVSSSLMSSATSTTMSIPSVTVTSSSAYSGTMTCSSAPSATMRSSAASSGRATSSSAPSNNMMISSSIERAQSSYPSKLPILAYRDPYATHYWSQSAEYGGHIINQSDRDGKPRITNVSDGHLSRKLRVGVWSQLDDPAGHEARHVVLANLRKAAPDRVCQLCSYNLLHNCSLTDFGATQHCKECCSVANKLQKSKITREYKEALDQM